MAAPRSKVLVLNAGSSSLKFKVFQWLGAGAGAGASAAAASAAASGVPELQPVAAGLCERIGDPAGGAVMRASAGPAGWRKGERIEQPMPDHGAALRLVASFLAGSLGGAGGGSPFQQDVLAVGHRVVHGGGIAHSVLIDDAARDSLEEVSHLAPLHNPPSLHCIDAARRLFPDAPHVACFDTTFHKTMPPDAYTYALPADLCREHSIRKYGFHGISYAYLTREAARMVGKPPEETNLIICHLGAGSSMCAVQGGRSVDTSMGFTPLEGLVMGSRCGDIDPAIVPFLMKMRGLGADEVDTLMNRKSGFLGMAGSIDVRNIEDCALAGDEACQLALAVFVRRVRKYLGAYLVHLGGRLDALVFSAGIGENGSMLRDMICADLAWAGIAGLDRAANDATIRGKAGEVQAAGSRAKVLVVPTDEQLEIALEALQVVQAAVD
ncbi:hypothetical protein ABPG75_004650 [Micractinium tetrahymenae]